MRSYGFFTDSDGNRSYGRMASFCLVLGAIVLGLFGRMDPIATFLTTALGFYAASKATQAYCERKHCDATGSVGRAGETR